MSNDNLRKIDSIYELINIRDYNRALSEIETLEKSQMNLRVPEQIKIILAKTKIYTALGDFNQALKYSDELLNNSQSLENTFQMLDAIYLKAKALSRLGELGKGLAYVKMGEKLLERVPKDNLHEVFYRKANLLFEKGYIFEQEEDLKNALDGYLQSLSLRREINDKVGLVESNNIISSIYLRMGDNIRALFMFQQSLGMYKDINDDIGIASTLDNIAQIYIWRGEYGPALENCLQALALGEEQKNPKIICRTLNTISRIYCYLGELNRSLEYLQRSQTINEENQNQKELAETLLLLSYVLMLKGELIKATDYLHQSQEVYSSLKDKIGITNVLENLGFLHYQKGEYTNAIEHLFQCANQRKQQMNVRAYIHTIFLLILVLIENNEFDAAQKQLVILQKEMEVQKNKKNILEYQLTSALILKRSSNFEILEKAKAIFLGIVNTELNDFLIYSIALFNLIELNLKELQLKEKYNEVGTVNALIDKHLILAKQIESHIMYVENFWLKANVSWLDNKTNEALLLFEQGEEITEEKGLRRLGMKINQAIKAIENNQHMQISLVDQSETTEENLIKANNRIVQMLNRKTVEITKLQNEEPVLLIIVYEGGVTVFSKKFSQKEMIDEMFVGGFLTAIDAFMHQTFATGGSIKRIQHQEYTLLLKAENALLFCYVYKGQSFTATQKLDTMIQELKKWHSVWNTLIQNLGEQLNPTDVKIIEELANQVFLEND